MRIATGKVDAIMGLSESKRTSFGKEDFFKQSYPQKIFSAVFDISGAIPMDGFAFLFLNWRVAPIDFMPEALEKIGAPIAANCCREAIDAAFPNGLPQLEEEISKSARCFNDHTSRVLSKLDEKFFANTEKLEELLYDFVILYPDDFGLPPFPGYSQGIPLTKREWG